MNEKKSMYDDNGNTICEYPDEIVDATQKFIDSIFDKYPEYDEKEILEEILEAADNYRVVINNLSV